MASSLDERGRKKERERTGEGGQKGGRGQKGEEKRWSIRGEGGRMDRNGAGEKEQGVKEERSQGDERSRAMGTEGHCGVAWRRGSAGAQTAPRTRPKP